MRRSTRAAITVAGGLTVMSAGVVADRALTWRHERNLLIQSATSRPVLVAPKPLRVLFIGDSIIASFPLSAFLPQNLVVHNAGVSRETTSQILERYRNESLARDCDVVVIEGGLNDLMRCVGHGWDKAAVLNQAVHNFTAEIELAQQRDQRAIVLGVHPITAPFLLATCRLVRLPEEFSVAQVNTMARDLNRRLAALCRERQVDFLDLGEVLVEGRDEGDRRYAARDGYHLNIDAYRRVAQALTPLLGDDLEPTRQAGLPR